MSAIVRGKKAWPLELDEFLVYTWTYCCKCTATKNSSPHSLNGNNASPGAGGHLWHVCKAAFKLLYCRLLLSSSRMSRRCYSILPSQMHQLCYFSRSYAAVATTKKKLKQFPHVRSNTLSCCSGLSDSWSTEGSVCPTEGELLKLRCAAVALIVHHNLLLCWSCATFDLCPWSDSEPANLRPHANILGIWVLFAILWLSKPLLFDFGK